VETLIYMTGWVETIVNHHHFFYFYINELTIYIYSLLRIRGCKSRMQRVNENRVGRKYSCCCFLFCAALARALRQQNKRRVCAAAESKQTPMCVLWPLLLLYANQPSAILINQPAHKRRVHKFARRRMLRKCRKNKYAVVLLMPF
jgi:hypothetical protein